MSVTVNIYYTGVNGAARQFVEEMERSGTATLIRNEAGNERYDYFSSLSDKETVLLIDSWIDQKAIDVHHATPMMQTITELRDKYNLKMKVERFISDNEEIPLKDIEFIRK